MSGTDITATLAAIDAVVGCHQCGGELGASPSDDFCSETCSRLWKAGRVGIATDDVGNPLLDRVAPVQPDPMHVASRLMDRLVAEMFRLRSGRGGG